MTDDEIVVCGDRGVSVVELVPLCEWLQGIQHKKSQPAVQRDFPHLDHPNILLINYFSELC